MTALPDVPVLENRALYAFLQAVRKGLADQVTTAVATATGVSTRQPRSLTLDFAGNPDGVTVNDATFSLAEAATDTTVYVGDGIFATALARSALTKRYTGSGLILLPASALPADFSYMAAKPTTWAVQGEAGWFRGDQKFSDGGEWKVIGPGVRTYDVVARYFESNCIPHHAWLDIESGSSGAQGYLTAGAAAGTSSVTIHAAGLAAWVGKQVNLCNSFGGAVVETKTVQSVVGAVVTFTTTLANTYTWNPAGGLAPNLSFAPRTWNGHTYIRVRGRGGGDNYGHIVRLNIEYAPPPSELVHTFNAMTGGQYGGSVDFISGSSGCYATGWESQYNDQGNDVAVIAQVDSFVRDNDRADNGGRMWLGTLLKSEGARASDAAHVVSGKWREALDTSTAVLMESTYLTAQANSGVTTLTVKWNTGARIGGTVTIAGSPTYSGSITAVSGATITITPATAAIYPVDSYVEFPNGGNIGNFALGQRMTWNATKSASNRGGDPLGVWSALYGNVQGDIETGTETDGSGDYWYTRFNGLAHSGAVARIRLRPTAFSANVDILGGATISATKELITNGYTAGGTFSGVLIFSAGSGNEIRFNTSTNTFQFYKAGTLVSSI